jgi:thiamine pyrophosphokinase
MKVNKLLILANAASEPASFIKKQAKLHDFVLAADGGANAALKAGVMPSLVIGDFDSITKQTAAKIGQAKLLKVARQDNTDLEKALDFAAYVKPQSVTIISAAGGRVDFTISNFSSAFKYLKLFPVIFAGAKWRVYPIETSAVFAANKGSTVSLIAMGKASGITLNGLKYPLKNAVLDVGMTAVSNIALKNDFKVSLKKGRLLVVIYPKI